MLPILSLNKRLLLFFLFLLMMFSCRKKTKLVGEYDVLVGEWELGFVVRENRQSHSTYYDTLFPVEIGDEYVMVFLEKGKLDFFKNKEIVDKYRVYIDKWNAEGIGSYNKSIKYFIVHLKKGGETTNLYGSFDAEGLEGSTDTIFYFRGAFPYSSNENCPLPGSCSYQHYYIRK